LGTLAGCWEGKALGRGVNGDHAVDDGVTGSGGTDSNVYEADEGDREANDQDEEM
jgi:hypothetical protein